MLLATSTFSIGGFGKFGGMFYCEQLENTFSMWDPGELTQKRLATFHIPAQSHIAALLTQELLNEALEFVS